MNIVLTKEEGTQLTGHFLAEWVAKCNFSIVNLET